MCGFFSSYFPMLKVGGLRLDMGPPQWICLCDCLKSVLKSHIVLAPCGEEFCTASTHRFAFSPGRIKVLQFPKWSFCSWFSDEPTAVSVCCSCSIPFQMRLAAGIQQPGCWVLLNKNHVTKRTHSKFRQECALHMTGGDFLSKMLPLWNRVAAPGVRENTAPQSSSSIPCFLWNPGRKWKQRWFLSPAFLLNTAFRHKLMKGCLPLSADKAKVSSGVICTA